MSDYSSLKATINANVKANNNHEITGSIMNSVLNAMVDSLGEGFQFMGVATPTNPGSAQTPDYKCFYLATTPGTYTYLGGLVVEDGEVAILKYDTSWTKEVTGIASVDQINQLKSILGEPIIAFVDHIDQNWQTVSVAAKQGDTIKVTMKNVGSNNDEPSIQADYTDGTSTILTYLDVNVGQTADFEFNAANDIKSISFGVSVARSQYEVSILNKSGIPKEINDIKTEISEISDALSSLDNRATDLEYQVLGEKRGVVDLVDNDIVYFDFTVPTSGAFSVLLKNVGTNTDTSGIGVVYTDNTSQVLTYIQGIPVGQSRSYNFAATKDIKQVFFAVAIARTIYNVIISKTNIIDNINSLDVKVNNLIDDTTINLFDGELLQGKAIDGYGAIIDDPNNIAVVTGKIPFNGHTEISCNHCYETWYYAIYNALDAPVYIGRVADVVTAVQNVAGGEYVRFTLRPMNYYRFPINIWYSADIHLDPKAVIRRFNKTVIITANSDENSDADFKGQTAIRQAIESITDFSGKTKYIIRCKGNFLATQPSDYEFGAEYSNWAMFWLYPFVELDGGNPDECIIRAELPDTVPSGYTTDIYSDYQPLYIGPGTEPVRNITFITRNCRYPLHMDSGNGNKEFLIENCRLIHEGKYGDAIGTTGGTACGFGIESKEHWVLKNCYFESINSGFYVHDNYDGEHSIVDVIGCVFNTNERTLRGAIIIQSLGKLTGTEVNISNCKFNKFSGITFNIGGTNPNGDRVDQYNRIKLSTDLSPIQVIADLGSSLRLTAANAVNSSIRVDETSSAFNLIFGYSDEVDYEEFNKYSYSQQYGYEWKDGDTGLPAVAIGFRRIENSGNCSLGARLGDCSETNKTLTLTVNGTPYDVVFNADYTAYSNTQVLDVINTQLSGVAVADIYRTADEMFPIFKDMGVEVVDDETPILVGMGVKFTESGVRKATAADESIDGIAIDSNIDSKHIRVIYSGVFSGNPLSFKRLCLASDTVIDHISFGALLGIASNEDGKFSINGTHKTLMGRTFNCVEFL